LREDVRVGAGELRNDVPTLVRAVNDNLLQDGEFSTSPVLGADLYEGDELSHPIVGEGNVLAHQKFANPQEGGLVALDCNVFADISNHRSKNYGFKNYGSRFLQTANTGTDRRRKPK